MPRRRASQVDDSSPTEEIVVSRDPDNPDTVVLSRWPTEEEKTDEFRAKLRAAQQG